MQLNLRAFFERAESYFPDRELVSREPGGSLFRYRYADYCRRVRRLADALSKLGIGAGDKVATLGWNTHRHLELYFAVPCLGAVLHTVNIRLSDEHIAYIVDHAADVALFVDPDLVPTVRRIAGRLPTLRHLVVLADEAGGEAPAGWRAYEDLVASGDERFAFAEVDENACCGMCFTSATTGEPKGVSYTQRGLYLHTLAVCLADSLAVGERDTLLPVVPMFHVNSWGLPYAAVATGAGIVLPGPQPAAADILDLIERERVTLCAAAVTVGVQMHAEQQRRRRDLGSLRALLLGGSATPRALMRRYLDDAGVPILTAWGATEAAPLATFTLVRRDVAAGGPEAAIEVRARQGIPLPGIELKVLDAEGRPVPHDDAHPGEVYVRGPWVATEYYRDARSRDGFVDGWWRSGDIATVGADGSIRLVDRAKDLIKSGGEWISSVDLENELVAHPGIAEAAVVAMPDPRWQERPAAYLVARPGAEPSADELREWLARRFVKWWLPERYVFVDALPKTGVGKLDKRKLRERAASLGGQPAGGDR
jgi:fatty-acyl-CoA synthase